MEGVNRIVNEAHKAEMRRHTGNTKASFRVTKDNHNYAETLGYIIAVITQRLIFHENT
jgi:hypothetical protein